MWRQHQGGMKGQRLPDRRRLLRGLLAGGLCLALVDMAPAQASEAVDPKIRFIKFPPILLPGKDRLAYLRLRFTLVVRESPQMQQEADLVSSYKPRIIGLVTERLPQENVVNRDSGPEQVNQLKEWLRDLANSIVGQPVVEEALIVSILTG